MLAGEYTLLVCNAIVGELIEKLAARGVACQDIETFVTLLDAAALGDDP